MYLTMSPLILAGISNMIFTKTSIYKKLKYPIDGFKTIKDGKRIFGENKTWIGFFSMIVFYCVFQVLCGIVCNTLELNPYNELYNIYENSFVFNSMFGLIAGFIYMLFELPNSFIKRRVNIQAGKTDKGIKGVAFFVIDQIDSLIGVMLLLTLFSNIGLSGYIRYLSIGALTHIFINIVLYLLKVRKNI